MDTKTIEILRKTTNDFYTRQCDSFSATRTHAWHGWETCLPVITSLWEGEPKPTPEPSSKKPSPLCVLDIACGNLRFEEFLSTKFPETDITFYAVDNCDELAVTPADSTKRHVNYQNLDVLDVLQEGSSIHDQLTAPTCDLSVSFGFMHHIPTQSYREKFLSALIDQTRSGGYVIVTFWQFLKSDTLRKKARASHDRALADLGLDSDPDALDENDYLLGWKDTPGVYRYCHSFSEREVDELAHSVESKARVVARFSADGKTNDLNTYLILQVL